MSWRTVADVTTYGQHFANTATNDLTTIKLFNSGLEATDVILDMT